MEIIKDVLEKDQKYQVFKDNDLISMMLKDNQLMFKDKNRKSIGFLPDKNSLICDRLIEIFHIENRDLFIKKYKEAVSGDGHEANNMLTIWSSSLCALLFFHNIDNRPLHLITTEGNSFVFDEVHFEYKNKVLNNPSNVDVVLIDHSNHAILFIESKFAEYLENDSIHISDKYYPYFDKIKDLTLKKKLTTPNENTIYHYGLKQLLTHYIGLEHFTKDSTHTYHKDDDRARVFDYYSRNPGTSVFLMEIVFNNNEVRKKDYFNNLNSLIESLTWNEKVKVLRPMTYQQIFANYDGIGEIIKQFYKII